MSEEATAAPDFENLMELFPEARLTIRDRLPMNMLLLYTFLNINKTIKDIKFTSEEIAESVLALVSMIPNEIRDEDFNKELENAIIETEEDVRPNYCEVQASANYCQKKGKNSVTVSYHINYFTVLHAVYNLLMRKHMLFKLQPKEIFTGKPYNLEESENE